MSPVTLEADLTPPLSRWLWLVKWLLLIPHFVCLIFLLIGFVLATIAAFVSLLFTGRYPRGLFDFNVGVLRWLWRVSFYGYNALAADRYPPFTLADVPDHPARLSIASPEQRRAGLPVIGRWLLGIPQYTIAGLFSGGGGFSWAGNYGYGGVIGALMVVVAVLLLFRDRYRQDVFDVVMGLNRWVFRVERLRGAADARVSALPVRPGRERAAGGLRDAGAKRLSQGSGRARAS